MSDTMQAYCVKCKTQREMLHPQAEYTASGTPGTRGKCPVCGTTLFRMGSTPAHANLAKPVIAPRVKITAKAKTVRKSKAASAKKTGTKATRTTARTATKSNAAKTTSAKKSGAKSADTLDKKRASGKLVIVESPAKARSVGQYLGKDYTVKASKGHVRDLLVSQISVDVNNNFEPKYRVMNDKRDVVKELQLAVKGAQEIYLATDPDREGEAIAWHLLAATEAEGKRIQRVVFHEITEPAVRDAFTHPREIDMNLVNAQQARRILDRLVGYNVTELLWEKVRNRLSAGRVQSIAVRIIVDREREITAFVPQEYWTLDARLAKQGQNGKPPRPIIARLFKIGDDEVNFGVEGDVMPHLAVLERSQFIVADVKRGERVRKPSAPFTTSTLQQEASRRLGFNARRTMSVAQQLYEGIELKGEGSVGLITYMRTDSMNVSAQAQAEAREYVINRFGATFVPDEIPVYKTRAKGAQEAHEAVRPTAVVRQPETVKSALSSDQFRLYQLVWQRFVASQMANTVYDTLRVEIDAGDREPRLYHFRVSGSTIKFIGFLALYEDARDEDTAKDEDEGRILPDMKVGERLDLIALLPEQHFTQPPPRYTEASLVRTLEEYGIGRPSTFAPTVAVIQDREYVVKKDKRLFASETGLIVNDLLVQNFPDIMDFGFTARMEDQLDSVAEGEMEWQPMLSEFYTPFALQLQTAKQTVPSRVKEEEIGRDCPVCGKPLIIRYGRFGKFIGCSDYPTCRHTEPWLEHVGVSCPICGVASGGQVVIKRSKKGKTFYGCARYPACEFTSWKRPLRSPCPNCGGMLVEQNRSTAQCILCATPVPMRDLPDETTEETDMETEMV